MTDPIKDKAKQEVARNFWPIVIILSLVVSFILGAVLF